MTLLISTNASCNSLRVKESLKVLIQKKHSFIFKLDFINKDLKRNYTENNNYWSLQDHCNFCLKQYMYNLRAVYKVTGMHHTFQYIETKNRVTYLSFIAVVHQTQVQVCTRKKTTVKTTLYKKWREWRNMTYFFIFISQLITLNKLLPIKLLADCKIEWINFLNNLIDFRAHERRNQPG